jgi:hypothetical protein
MPCTSPSKEPVPSHDSRHGTVRANFSSRPSGVPTVNTENGAQLSRVS